MASRGSAAQRRRGASDSSSASTRCGSARPQVRDIPHPRCPQLTCSRVLVDGYTPVRLLRGRRALRNGQLSSPRAARRRCCCAIYEPRVSSPRGDSRLPQYGSMLEGRPDPAHPVGSTSQPDRSDRDSDRRRHGARGEAPRAAATRVWVLCGDSEMAEGSIWEALEHAAHFELDNLTAIIDMNRLGQRGETMVGWNLDAYARRAEAFGWNAIEIDGHDSRRSTTRSARRSPTDGQPTVVIARTLKGKGVAAVENKNGWHGKPLRGSRGGDRRARRLRDIASRSRSPSLRRPAARRRDSRLELPRYELGDEVATRKAYGDALAALGAARPDVVALDGEVSNSTYAETFAKASRSATSRCTSPSSRWSRRRSGCRSLGWTPVRLDLRRVPLAGVRLRPHGRDQPRDLSLCGSHAGVSIGEDGPSQMALEDIAVAPRDPRLAPCSIRATRTRRRSSSPPWPRPTGSPTCARSRRRRRSSTRRTRSSRSAAAASLRSTRRRRGRRSSAPGSPCTRR